MATAETCEPLHLSQFEHVWHSSHQAGVGKRLAVAFIQHFGLGMDALGKLGKQAASHSLLDALPRPAATQTTAHTSPHLHPHTKAQRPTYSLEPIAEHARRRCGEDMVKEEPNTPETPLMSPCDAPPFTSIQTINHTSACEAGSPFSSISSETTDMTLGESCNTTSELAALPMVRVTSFQAVDKVQNFDDMWQTWGSCFFQDTPVSVY